MGYTVDQHKTEIMLEEYGSSDDNYNNDWIHKKHNAPIIAVVWHDKRKVLSFII
jgi:hypothetical protein